MEKGETLDRKRRGQMGKTQGKSETKGDIKVRPKVLLSLVLSFLSFSSLILFFFYSF